MKKWAKDLKYKIMVFFILYKVRLRLKKSGLKKPEVELIVSKIRDVK